jgi:molybdopterin synthase catalytic subunit
MPVEITGRPFDPCRRAADWQEKMEAAGRFGAQALFIGYMRDFNEGDRVRAMTLEHYPGMTERHLLDIATEAGRRWELLDVLIIHRIGEIRIGEAIVLVSVWSAHRAAAFDACRWIMEDLKARTPFWKKEQLEDGERWVKQNTSGISE